MRSTRYMSFSVLGLGLLLALGIIVVMIEYSMEAIAQCCQKRFKHNAYHRLEWDTNDTLQLHRLAHEEAEFGTWKVKSGRNPVLNNPGERLAILDISDPKHPRLKRKDSEPVSPGTVVEKTSRATVTDGRSKGPAKQRPISVSVRRVRTDLSASSESSDDRSPRITVAPEIRRA